MPVKRKPRDREIAAIISALSAHKRAHPHARVQVRRRNNVTIHVRIIDPDFSKIGPTARESAVWRLIERLPARVLTQITILLLLTP